MAYLTSYGPITFAANAGPWNGYTGRMIIPVGSLSYSGSTIKLKMGHYNTNWSFGKCYIGHQAASGDPYDFDGGQAQVLFAGSPGATVTAGGLLSDPVSFNLDKSRKLIVSVYITSTSAPKLDAADYAVWYKSGDDAATQNASGYTLDSPKKLAVSEIQVETLESLEDISLSCAAYLRSIEDITTFLRAHNGLEFEDLGIDLPTLIANPTELMDLGVELTAYGLSRSDFSAFLKAAGWAGCNLLMDLAAVSPIAMLDLGAALHATDGMVLQNVALSLIAIRQTPAFRAVMGQRLSSVLKEVF